MKDELTGPFIVLTKSGLVFGATSVQATPTDLVVHWKGLEHRLHPDDIEIVYEVDPHHPAASIDPGILSTLIALERLVLEFAQERPVPIVTLYESGSLALTLVPNRTTNDLDVIASDGFASFVSHRPIETDLEIELLDERLLRLLGPWISRTSELRGPLGAEFRLVHPLDTVMQKLLRYSEERFVEKDQGDIDAVMQKLMPSRETLLMLLTENPGRYALLPGSFSTQVQAIERNTCWFLSQYLAGYSYSDILQLTGDRAVAPAVQAGLLPGINNVDFKKFVRRRPPGGFR